MDFKNVNLHEIELEFVEMRLSLIRNFVHATALTSMLFNSLVSKVLHLNVGSWIATYKLYEQNDIRSRLWYDICIDANHWPVAPKYTK